MIPNILKFKVKTNLLSTINNIDYFEDAREVGSKDLEIKDHSSSPALILAININN